MEKHELVDINGNRTGNVLTNMEVCDLNNVPSGQYISVVGVVIINSENEVLLQKRSRFKVANPGKWGVCGGKVNLDESIVDAGIRETSEEIGIELDRRKVKFLSTNIIGKAHFTVYYIVQDVDVNKCKIQKEELDEVKYFKIEELETLDNEGFEWLTNLEKIINKI